MQHDAKPYIPPHLRGGPVDESGRPANKSAEGWGSNDFRQGQSWGNNKGWDEYGSQQPQYSSRWSGLNDRGSQGRGYGNSYGGERNNYNDRNSYGNNNNRYGGRSSKTNNLGLHGDLTPNPHVENELFNNPDCQTTGINFDKYDDIPVEVSEGCPPPYNDFTQESVGDALLKNLALMRYSKPTPVQKYSIPIGLAGGDMMACAQTGSGKTAGFLFPVIHSILKSVPFPLPTTFSRSARPITLVLAPTRELACQIYDEALKFCYCTGIRPVVVYGGASVQNQYKELERGADLLVATPGRLVDLIERGSIRLDSIKFLVLDEADRMLDMGFEPQIRRIVEQEGMSPDRQTFMFSATFPVEIQRLAGDFMKNYSFLAVGRVGAASKDVTQTIEWVETNQKIGFLIDFLSRAPDGLVLIFVETKRGADYLEESLCRENLSAISIHGDKSQREREDALKQFKSGRIPILVATDVAARGLDIPNVTQVINYDLPSNIVDYVHRIGRTGRVGNVGHSLSMMNERNRNIAKDLTELLIENEQECPPWLERMAGPSFNGYKRGGRGGRGGKQFGARDIRRDGRGNSNFSNSSHGEGGRGGGGGGHQHYHSNRGGERGVNQDNSAW